MERTQVNSIAQRSQRAIADAFLLLIQEKTYEEISVTEICKNADIVRKTFYNRFSSKDAVVRFLIDDFTQELESLVDLKRMDVKKMLMIAFQAVLENRERLLLFYNRGLFRFAHKSISAYIERSNLLNPLPDGAEDERYSPYIAAQFSAILVSVIETWIERDMQESIEFLANLTEKMIIRSAPEINDIELAIE